MYCDPFLFFSWIRELSSGTKNPCPSLQLLLCVHYIIVLTNQERIIFFHVPTSRLRTIRMVRSILNCNGHTLRYRRTAAIFLCLSYSMEHSPSAVDGISACQEILHLIETKSSFLCLQELAIGPYPFEFIHNLRSYFFSINFHIILPSSFWSLKWSLPLKIFE